MLSGPCIAACRLTEFYMQARAKQKWHSAEEKKSPPLQKLTLFVSPHASFKFDRVNTHLIIGAVVQWCTCMFSHA